MTQYDRNGVVKAIEDAMPGGFYTHMALPNRVRTMAEMWNRAMLVNKDLEAENARLEARIEGAEDNGWCFDCQKLIGFTSHYHCGNCGAPMEGMFEHYYYGVFNCKPKEAPTEGAGMSEQGRGEG